MKLSVPCWTSAVADALRRRKRWLRAGRHCCGEYCNRDRAQHHWLRTARTARDGSGFSPWPHPSQGRRTQAFDTNRPDTSERPGRACRSSHARRSDVAVEMDIEKPAEPGGGALCHGPSRRSRRGRHAAESSLAIRFRPIARRSRDPDTSIVTRSSATLPKRSRAPSPRVNWPSRLIRRRKNWSAPSRTADANTGRPVPPSRCASTTSSIPSSGVPPPTGF